MSKASAARSLDVIIVGAGFAGLYALYRCRQLGLKARAVERGTGVGGTWFWNRYPGARCDIESLYYSYSFSKELERSWNWSSRYAAQPEILQYLNHVADRFELRSDIQLETSVKSAKWNEATARWTVETDRGTFEARFYVMATGCLSAGQLPNVPGIGSFKGAHYHTGDWLREGVDFKDKRVAVIGTGSSAIQMAPLVAQQAQHLYMFQRTPQYAVPARNMEISDVQMKEAQAQYDEIRASMRASFVGIPFVPREVGAAADTPESREQVFQEAWQRGGYMMLTCYPDLITNEKSNELLGEFAWKQISQRIQDPRSWPWTSAAVAACRFATPGRTVQRIIWA
jgi:cyclohexanone monooxygenase